MAHLGEIDRALATIDAALRIDDVFVRLTALNVALRLDTLARPLLPSIERAAIESPDQKDTSVYVNRMVKYLRGRIGED